MGDKRNYSLSLWDNQNNFLCLLKSPNEEINGQSYDEQIIEDIYGEKTLTFTIPAYINNYQENNNFKENDKWNYIFNEQKVRYVEYDNITNKPIKTKEFILKHYDENRNGYEKTINCQCESLATYELTKIGWSINFDTNYITQYEIENNPDDFLTLDYWLKKIFYKETNLGRVSTTTECTYLLQGLQLRDNEGWPIDKNYTINDKKDYIFNRIDEPSCTTLDEYEKYINEAGWTWEIQAIDSRFIDSSITTSILYENPVIDRYIEVTPNNYVGMSYQKLINSDDSTKQLRIHPLEDSSWQYVTDIKKRLVSCERSNIFSIIQELSEIFQVWPHFIYTYDDNGCITERKIIFKSKVINEDINFDFSYGKNLQSCNRSIDSNELITKLIIPDTESSLDSNKILSIKQASANPTGEGYLYNFDYFYNIGSLSRLTNNEKIGSSQYPHSDEYEINLHCGKLKNLNNEITNIQKFLVPLYDRQNTLKSDLSVKNGVTKFVTF